MPSSASTIADGQKECAGKSKSTTGSVPVMVILGSRSCSMIGYFAYDQF